MLRRVFGCFWSALYVFVLWRCLQRIWNAGVLVLYFSPLEWSRPEVAEIGEFGIDNPALSIP